MKTKFKITYIIGVIIFLLLTTLLFSQERVSIGIYQDVKLATQADDYGNKPFTRDLIIRLNMQGNQQSFGYMVMFPEFETADLKGGLYSRWSANGGYVFNFIKNVELSATVGIGVIHRHKVGYASFGGGGTISYQINRIKLVSLWQLTSRKDIDKIRNSLFFGIEINL